MNMTPNSSALICVMCSLMYAVCLYGEKLSMGLRLREAVTINYQQP